MSFRLACSSHLLRRHVEYGRAHVDLCVVLDAGKDEEYACGKQLQSQHDHYVNEVEPHDIAPR